MSMRLQRMLHSIRWCAEPAEISLPAVSWRSGIRNPESRFMQCFLKGRRHRSDSMAAFSCAVIFKAFRTGTLTDARDPKRTIATLSYRHGNTESEEGACDPRSAETVCCLGGRRTPTSWRQAARLPAGGGIRRLTPKGLRMSAQGCRVLEAALGIGRHRHALPRRGCIADVIQPLRGRGRSSSGHPG